MSIPSYPIIHALLSPEEGNAGYLLELETLETLAETLDSLRASPDFASFDHRHPWFIPACDIAPDTRLIPTFQANVAQPELEARLRQARHKLALRTTPDVKLPATGAWDHLLIGLSQARSLPPFALQGLSSRTLIIACDVHSQADRDWAIGNTCALTTGEYLFSRGLPGKKADTTRQKMLQLLSLIAEDADTEALDEVFRQETKLAYSLLRLVNSAAIAPRSPITSFAQAINLLGRRQLQRWLQLLVYADPNNGQHPTPLLYKAAARGRLLEHLAPSLLGEVSTDLADCAFMIGSFSLLDVLLNIPMPEILQQLPLADVVRDALGRHEGVLGKLLAALEAADKRELRSAGTRLAELNISAAEFFAAQLDSLSWSNRIRPGT